MDSSGLPTGDDAGPKAEAEQRPAATADRSKLWFDETVVVPDAFRDLLVNYSRIPAADVDEHVVQIVSPRHMRPSLSCPPAHG